MFEIASKFLFWKTFLLLIKFNTLNVSKLQNILENFYYLYLLKDLQINILQTTNGVTFSHFDFHTNLFL